MAFVFGKDSLNTQRLVELSSHPLKSISVDPPAKATLKKYRKIVDDAIDSKETVYGINTGFGYLSHVDVEETKLRQLQLNLIRSHACGVGPMLAPEISRGILILRLHTFLSGHSGVSDNCVDIIVKFLEHDILPVVPSQGSVGASGDLAPLAHIALGLIGEGQVFYQGKIVDVGELLGKLAIAPLIPQPKEGLSLINGTHVMTVLAAFAVERAKVLVRSADVITAMSLDAICGTTVAFSEGIQALRPHPGQQDVAANLRDLFADHDEILESHKDCKKVQDPYSFRCAPQVHGASRDMLAVVEKTVNIELNSMTDNPLCLEDGSIVSGGNFHGQPIALVSDLLAMAMAEMGSISERRIEKLINPNMSGLPAFLTKNSGLESGFMIPHVVAAAIVSENKTLCHPASVDSIPTSADKEDHVSMGTIAARKAQNVIKNVSRILAIELLAACQGLDLLLPLKPNKRLLAVYDGLRSISPGLTYDRSLSEDIEQVRCWIIDGNILRVLKKVKVELK